MLKVISYIEDFADSLKEEGFIKEAYQLDVCANTLSSDNLDKGRYFIKIYTEATG